MADPEDKRSKAEVEGDLTNVFGSFKKQSSTINEDKNTEKVQNDQENNQPENTEQDNQNQSPTVEIS